MFDDTTAFRHFGCGGPIQRRQTPQGLIYKCAICWARSADMLDLIEDPNLAKSKQYQENPPTIPE